MSLSTELPRVADTDAGRQCDCRLRRASGVSLGRRHQAVSSGTMARAYGSVRDASAPALRDRPRLSPRLPGPGTARRFPAGGRRAGIRPAVHAGAASGWVRNYARHSAAACPQWHGAAEPGVWRRDLPRREPLVDRRLDQPRRTAAQQHRGPARGSRDRGGGDPESLPASAISCRSRSRSAAWSQWVGVATGLSTAPSPNADCRLESTPAASTGTHRCRDRAGALSSRSSITSHRSTCSRSSPAWSWKACWKSSPT